MRFFARDAQFVLDPRREWVAVAAEQAKRPRLWPRAAFVVLTLCATDLLEIALCAPGLASPGRLWSVTVLAVVISLALDVVSIAVSLAVKSFVAPLLAQSLGGGGDQRPGAALVVYATLNTGFLALNALSLDAACSDAGARWVFGEGLLAHLLSWSLFGAYASYAVHLLRHGGMVLLGVPAERATAFALLLLLPEVAGVLMLDLGPGPLLVLVDLVGA